MTFDPAALAEYREWHRAQVRTGDIDPAYPFLRAYAKVNLLNGAALAALTLAYAATYHLGSAIWAWTAAGETLPRAHDFGAHPVCGVERRGHRSRMALAEHLASLATVTRAAGGPYVWLTGADDWGDMIARGQRVHGNGRWAAYKTAELAEKVAGAPYRATDAGHRHSTGPRQALRLLGVKDPGDNSAATVAYLEEVTAALARLIDEPDLAQVETSLCDWRSHRAGRHPMGHDIEMVARQVEGCPGAQAAWDQSGLCLIC